METIDEKAKMMHNKDIETILRPHSTRPTLTALPQYHHYVCNGNDHVKYSLFHPIIFTLMLDLIYLLCIAHTSTSRLRT